MSIADLLGNDWGPLVPDRDMTWTPTRTVSVCVPTRNPGPGLERTLRCLAEQTYPSHLFEVVVADDGTDDQISLPPDLGYSCQLVRQERTLDFGAGRARNTAARAASGDILFFLDADVIPERQVIESYARWFEFSDLVVPMGLCRFVDVDDLTTRELADLVADGQLAAHFHGRDVDDQDWREKTFRRTDDLRIESADAFRITIGATLAVSRYQFDAVGGFRELGIRGVEDTEFGYRLHANGAVLILDRDALHWHQGRRNLTSERRAEIDLVRAPFVQNLLPVRGFRRGEPPEPPVEPVSIEPVPVFRVQIVGDEAARERSRRSIEALESANVVVAEADDEATEFDPAFARVMLPAGVVWTKKTYGALRDMFTTRKVGVIRALSVDESGAEVTIVRTRALRRAVQVRPDADPIEVAAELFGVWWADADSLAFETLTRAEPEHPMPPSEADQPVAASGGPSPGIVRRLRGGFRQCRRRIGKRTYEAVAARLKKYAK